MESKGAPTPMMKQFILYDERQLQPQGQHAQQPQPVAPPQPQRGRPHATSSSAPSTISYRSQTTSRSRHQQQPRPPLSQTNDMATGSSRFVAGTAFFNYETFGSLRPEFQPVDLFSSAFLGLAVNAVVSGFTVTLIKNGFRQLLAEYLRVHDDSYGTSTKYLLEWPASFSIFMGFLSDCRPIQGRRRKPYMILGWAVSFLMMAIIALLDFTVAKSHEVLDIHPEASASREEIQQRVIQYDGVLLALTVATSFMLQLVNIASLSMTVEFAQREMLQERGKLQAMYFVLFYGAAACAQFLSTLFIVADDDGHVRGELSLGGTALVLAGSCLVPLPFLYKYLDEPSIAGTVHFSVRRRVHELWRFCHQNVVIRILFFLVGHMCILGIYNGNVRDAITTWCGITPAKQTGVNAVDTSAFCLALIFWMLFMVNWSWRWLAGVGTIVYILSYLFFNAMITFDVSRSYWFYTIVLSILDMPRAWIRLYAVVLSTEIADNGREGVTMGLVAALQSLVSVSAHMLSAKIGQWLPFTVSIDSDVLLDTQETRNRVFYGGLVTFGINFLSFFIVLVLPNQKLDAQQKRAFGGYNRYASYGVAAMFCVLFIANCGLNILALV